MVASQYAQTRVKRLHTEWSKKKCPLSYCTAQYQYATQARSESSKRPEDVTVGTINVFISHIHEDDPVLGKLKDIASANGLTLKDASINASKPNQAKSPDYILNKLIRRRINWCSVLPVIITPDTKESEWVKKEIMLAAKLGKRIVGIWPHGHANCEEPEILKQLADSIVPWNGSKIVQALTGEFNGRQNPDGGECTPIPFRRYRCR